MGLNKIAENTSEQVDMSPAYGLFPHIPQGALDRPVGKVQLLIGQDNADLLSIGGYGRNRINKLRVMECPYGSGFVLTSTHPTIKFNPCLLSEETRAIQNNIVVH